MTTLTYQATDSRLESPLGDELVVLGVASALYYVLSPGGAFLWKHLATPRVAAELVDALVAEFEVERSVAEADVSDLLEQLEAHGLVTVRPVG